MLGYRFLFCFIIFFVGIKILILIFIFTYIIQITIQQDFVSFVCELECDIYLGRFSNENEFPPNREGSSNENEFLQNREGYSYLYRKKTNE